MADEDVQTGQAGQTDQPPQQQFVMQRIFAKDLSFESPSSPNIFKKQWQPKVNVELNTKSDLIDEQGNYEVVLTVTITSKVDDETAYLVEGEDLRRILGTAAPNILFPYARENIDSVCVKGGFPPVMLAPVNFEALYQQALTQSQNQAAEGGAEASTH